VALFAFIMLSGGTLFAAGTRAVAVLGSPYDPAWLDEVQAKLVATGAFASVDKINIQFTTPTLAQLKQYASVLVFTDRAAADRVTLGNNLADYVDAGGGVVMASFAFNTFDGNIAGRFNTDDYWALEPAFQTSGAATLGTVYEANSPIMAGVSSFDGGTRSFRHPGAVNANAVRVADWSDGLPLVVRRTINGTKRVDLNFYPPSSDSLDGLWVSSTDGAKLMANSLLFAGSVEILLNNFDAGNVQRYTQTGTLTKTYTATGAPDAEGAAVTPDGKVVTTASNSITASTVNIFYPDGTLATSFSAGPNTIPGDVSVFADGTLAIIDQDNTTVQFFSQIGTLIRTVTLPAGSGPFGSTVGTDNVLYVANTDGSGFERIKADGTDLGTVALSFHPADIVMSPADGTLWINDFFAAVIHHVKTDGTEIGSFPATGLSGAGSGIGITPDGTSLYVTRMSSAVIRHYDLAGNTLDDITITNPSNPLFLTVTGPPPPNVSPVITTQASPATTVGNPISDSATVALGQSPGGTITFNLYGPADATCGGTPVFTSAAVPVTGNGGGYGSGNFTPTVAGTYRWVASYSGDAQNNAVIGGCNDANESVVVTDPKPDFDGDEHPDILFQNFTTGERRIWLMNGTAHSSTVNLASIPPNWRFMALADFNGDGNPDIVVQNIKTGARLIRLMNDTTLGAAVQLGYVSLEWNIATAADFDGDGKPDIVFQNSTTGERYIWLMDGTTHVSTVSLGTIAKEWVIVASDDFNADGKTDLVFQNTSNGQRVIALMNSTTFTKVVHLGKIDLEWDIAGAGDYNADGKPDLIFQNTSTGERVFVLMDGTTMSSVAPFGKPAVQWSIRNH
jgi:streptogramin lyase